MCAVVLLHGHGILVICAATVSHAIQVAAHQVEGSHLGVSCHVHTVIDIDKYCLQLSPRRTPRVQERNIPLVMLTHKWAVGRSFGPVWEGKRRFRPPLVSHLWVK